MANQEKSWVSVQTLIHSLLCCCDLRSSLYTAQLLIGWFSFDETRFRIDITPLPVGPASSGLLQPESQINNQQIPRMFISVWKLLQHLHTLPTGRPTWLTRTTLHPRLSHHAQGSRGASEEPTASTRRQHSGVTVGASDTWNMRDSSTRHYL